MGCEPKLSLIFPNLSEYCINNGIVNIEPRTPDL